MTETPGTYSIKGEPMRACEIQFGRVRRSGVIRRAIEADIVEQIHLLNPVFQNGFNNIESVF